MAVEYDLTVILARLAAMQKEAVSGCDAAPYWPYQQEATPYWFNRINSMAVDTSLAGDYDLDRYTIEMGLVIAHITQGYQGENYTKIAGWIDDVLSYFEDRGYLNTNAGDYTADYGYIWMEEGGAVITGIPGGTRTINNDGVGATQLYLGFILDLPLMRERY